MKILFFIDSLISGGRERRLVELLFYLKKHTNYELCLILTEETIDYQYIKELEIPIFIVKRRIFKYDPSLFFRFYKIAEKFKPDIIHTWSMMTTWYAIPTKLIMKNTLIANLIADAKRKSTRLTMSKLFYYIDFVFADVILGNSNAGFEAYGLQKNKKTHLIYNGVRLERFSKLIDTDNIRKRFYIKTPHVIIMVASASKNKDYDLLLDIAKHLAHKRDDITFLGVGGGSELERLKNRIRSEDIKNVKLLGKRNDVEEFCAIADIGLLFTNTEAHSEGISNAIIEYMAMGKPVITTDTLGGSYEIIEEGNSGFIISKNIENIANKISELLGNRKLMKQLGNKGKTIIHQKFSIERMGSEYVTLYERLGKLKDKF